MVRKYIWIAALVIAALIIYLLWGWLIKPDRADDPCAMANEKAEQFQKAIDEFGELTPENAALLWSKGVQERNGALQYSVMSDQLKKVYKIHMDKNYPAWVTGVSSPWVEKFELIDSKKVSNSEYVVTMQFSLATSAGSAGKHLAKLTVVKEGSYWKINAVSADEIILELSGLDFIE